MINVVTPETYGGIRDSEVPVCVAYNQYHYESMHPTTLKDVELMQELINQSTAIPSTYRYGKKDIADLIKPLKTVTDVPLAESSTEAPTKKKKTAKTDAER